MKVAIVGGSPTTRHLAPFDDPDWQIWALAWHRKGLPRYDLLFEMHDCTIKPWCRLPHDYKAFLKGNRGVIANPNTAKKMKCRAYPLGRARAIAGNYFSSSIAYMIALAILEGVTELSLYGVDMAEDEEYVHQRPNCEYWIGRAEAGGMKVTVAEGSALKTFDTHYGQESPHHTLQTHRDNFELYLDQVQQLCEAQSGQTTGDTKAGWIASKQTAQTIAEAYRLHTRGCAIDGMAKVEHG